MARTCYALGISNGYLFTAGLVSKFVYLWLASHTSLSLSPQVWNLRDFLSMCGKGQSQVTLVLWIPIDSVT